MPSSAPAESSAPAATDLAATDITWRRAFLVGGGVGGIAETRLAYVGPETAVQLFVALEGERGGLPVFCCEAPLIRVDGRAVPARLVVPPADAGLSDVEIRWSEMRPAPDGPGWTRLAIRLQQGDWSLPVYELPAGAGEGIDPSVGTARYAVALSFRDAAGRRVRLDSERGAAGGDLADPRLAPGFRVSRHGGDTLPGRAGARARLPVRAEVDPAFVHAFIALRPADPFLAAYADLADAPWPDSVSTDLADPSWEWLLEAVAHGRRRATGDTPVVGPDGHAVRWRGVDGTSGVAAGDVVFSGGYAGFLQGDDDDGFLDNDDRALHGARGTLAFGRIRDLPEGRITVLRPRDFRGVSAQLDQAGYGPLPIEMVWTSRARRAMRAFQGDQGLPVTGLPDAESRRRLDAMLDRMRAVDDAAPPDSAR